MAQTNTVRISSRDISHLVSHVLIFPCISGVTVDIDVCRTSGHLWVLSCIRELCNVLSDWVSDFDGNKIHLFIHLWSCLFLSLTDGGKNGALVEASTGNVGSSLCLLPPSPGGEHLCMTLSISTSLAPILVECELAFGKSQRGHLVTLSGTLELRRPRMMMQKGTIPEASGISKGFHLGDFLGSFSSSLHPSRHSRRLRGTLFFFCHGFINSGRVGKVSILWVLKQKWRDKTLLITVQPFWEPHKDIRKCLILLREPGSLWKWSETIGTAHCRSSAEQRSSSCKHKQFTCNLTWRCSARAPWCYSWCFPLFFLYSWHQFQSDDSIPGQGFCELWMRYTNIDPLARG